MGGHNAFRLNDSQVKIITDMEHFENVLFQIIFDRTVK